MSDLPSLPVDLGDPKDIRAKLPRAERILERLEREVSESQDRLARWLVLVEGLRSVAGASPRAGDADDSAAVREDGVGVPKAPGRAQMQELVLEAINRHGGPIRSRDLHAKLAEAGHADLTLDSVSNALWYAAERLRTVKKVGRGIYAPLDPNAEAQADAPDDGGVGGPMMQASPPGPPTIPAHPLHNGTVRAPAPAMIRT